MWIFIGFSLISICVRVVISYLLSKLGFVICFFFFGEFVFKDQFRIQWSWWKYINKGNSNTIEGKTYINRLIKEGKQVLYYIGKYFLVLKQLSFVYNSIILVCYVSLFPFPVAVVIHSNKILNSIRLQAMCCCSCIVLRQQLCFFIWFHYTHLSIFPCYLF